MATLAARPSPPYPSAMRQRPNSKDAGPSIWIFVLLLASAGVLAVAGVMAALQLGWM